jgi:hypothetical protein
LQPGYKVPQSIKSRAIKTLKPFYQNFLVKLFAAFILLTIIWFECQEVTDHPAPATKTGIDAVIYNSDWRAGFVSMGNLTLTTPHDPSPLPDFTGLSNSQALMAAGSSHESGWHFFGDDEKGFFYTDPFRFFRMAVSLYLCVVGGSGSAGDYTISLTANSDLSIYLVRIPDTDPASDYGHADLRICLMLMSLFGMCCANGLLITLLKLIIKHYIAVLNSHNLFDR